MEKNLFNRDNYVFKLLPIKREEDKDSCIQLLTRSNRHLLLCNKTYSDEHIRKIVEASDYILFHHRIQNVEDIVGFALVSLKKKAVDILLLCAIQNNERFGNMIANSVYNFGITKKCNKIYASPRTPLLRKTFIKYGFEHLRGVEDIDEVLVKMIVIQSYNISNKTRRVRNKTNNKQISHYSSIELGM